MMNQTTLNWASAAPDKSFENERTSKAVSKFHMTQKGFNTTTNSIPSTSENPQMRKSMAGFNSKKNNKFPQLAPIAQSKLIGRSNLGATNSSVEDSKDFGDSSFRSSAIKNSTRLRIHADPGSQLTSSHNQPPPKIVETRKRMRSMLGGNKGTSINNINRAVRVYRGHRQPTN
jgi:hypothetical protein